MMGHNEHSVRIGRRALLSRGTLLLATAAAADDASLLAGPPESEIRIGMVTDLHHAEKPPAGTRHYRETMDKLAEAASAFDRDKPLFLVELGDLIDAADAVATEQQYLKTVNREFSAICADRHYVLGNHCVDTLTKDEFLGGVGQLQSYYSFDRAGFHFVVLDSCFRSDGEPYGRKNSHWTDANVPAAELEWLESDLKATDRSTIIFAHQRLDVSNNHGVKNCAAVRRILEASGNVLAVFQGHSHRNDLSEIGGIHYCTLRAMIEGSGAENNGYSMLRIDPRGNIRIAGYRQQADYAWNRSG